MYKNQIKSEGKYFTTRGASLTKQQLIKTF